MALPLPKIPTHTRDDYRPAPKSGSGEHPAVKRYRDKLQSIHEHTVPEFTTPEAPPPRK
jgi:hypothetical protein